MTTHRKLGAAIALVAAIGAVMGIFVAQFSTSLAVGITVVGIVLGTAVAHGYFSAQTPDSATRKN